MSKPSAQIGQHLFIGLPGTELSPENRRLLNTIQPGGIVLFARNVESSAQLHAFRRELLPHLPTRPLMAIDQEQGRVNRLRNVVGEVPTIAELKQSGNVNVAQKFGRTTGRWLRQFGIDIDFAPVLDLEFFGPGTENALRDRCWGRTANEVTNWAGAFLAGLQEEGVAACPKHFPGLGAASLDSHEQLPTIDRSREELMSEDAGPFVQLMPRVDAIMVGHGYYPALDPAGSQRPASLSRPIISDLLRQKLGFAGLVLTDDLDMGAISRCGSVEEAAVEAFNAGVDIVLVCHTPDKMLAAHAALVNAVESGIITPERLAESQRRIRAFRVRRRL